MRGGAIPLLAWAALLFVLAVGDAVWNAKLVNGLTAAFAVIVVLGAAAAIVGLGRGEALRRGPPSPEAGARGFPQASLGAVLVALSVAAILFGVVWARFLVYAGGVALAASLGRLWLEVRAQRRAVGRRGGGP